MFIDQLEKGLSWSRYVCSSLPLSERSFTTRWKEANNQFTERLSERNKIVERETIKIMKEQAQRAGLDKVAKLILLENIMTNEDEKTTDRIKAIETHNRMMGESEPEQSVKIQTGFWAKIRESLEDD
jgi:hypothetical protein